MSLVLRTPTRSDAANGGSDPSPSARLAASLPGCAHVGTTEHRSVMVIWGEHGDPPFPNVGVDDPSPLECWNEALSCILNVISWTNNFLIHVMFLDGL